jgi:hypothetical protein
MDVVLPRGAELEKMCVEGLFLGLIQRPDRPYSWDDLPLQPAADKATCAKALRVASGVTVD